MFRDYQTKGPLSKRFIKLDINCVVLHCFYGSEFRTRMESVIEDLDVRIDSSTNYQLQKIKAKQPHGWAYAAKVLIVMGFISLVAQAIELFNL